MLTNSAQMTSAQANDAW